MKKIKKFRDSATCRSIDRRATRRQLHGVKCFSFSFLQQHGAVARGFSSTSWLLPMRRLSVNSVGRRIVCFGFAARETWIHSRAVYATWHRPAIIMDRAFLNVMILSWGFMLVFTAFQTMGNIEVGAVDYCHYRCYHSRVAFPSVNSVVESTSLGSSFSRKSINSEQEIRFHAWTGASLRLFDFLKNSSASSKRCVLITASSDNDASRRRSLDKSTRSRVPASKQFFSNGSKQVSARRKQFFLRFLFRKKCSTVEDVREIKNDLRYATIDETYN